MTTIDIRYVDTHPNRNVVSVLHQHPDGHRYGVGHLIGQGWFCLCPRGKTCPAIAEVQQLVPTIPTTQAKPAQQAQAARAPQNRSGE